MCIFEVVDVDTDALSYDGRHPNKIMYHHNQRKGGKYLKDYLDRGLQFAPLVFSMDGVMGEKKKKAA